MAAVLPSAGRVAHVSFELTIDAPSSKTTTVSMQRVALPRALLLWVGEGAGPPSLGALLAAVPSRGASTRLLEAADGEDSDEAASFAAALAARAGRVVLLAWAIPERVLDDDARQEVRRRALAFVEDAKE